ncbi:MAG: AAA family ATPase [Planctomycetes bacterium]|nr:AAA family ATPase [Planctomycetota bacterium]
MSNRVFLNRVVLKNYKSIAACDVRLGTLMFLVGPNGAGKSNFLDALRFVADSLRTSLDHALRDRGGIKEVRRRSGGHPTHFGVRLEFTLQDASRGHYAFQIGAVQQAGYDVLQEECVVHEATASAPKHFFRVRSGHVIDSSVPNPPAAASDRLYLVNASGLPVFRPSYDALSRMGFYNINPQSVRELQSPDTGELLVRDAGNIASVLSVLGRSHAKAKARIEEYLSKVVPGLRGVDVKAVGPMETLEFRQTVAGSRDPWRFFAQSMSDGTLRALGVLVSLFQGFDGAASRVPLVAIEEPEVALHPAAAGVLLDVLEEASHRTQVLVTSHSPDLLDDQKIGTESILAVDAVDGTTRIAPLEEVGRKALRDRLYTPGELLRLNQLVPDPQAVPDSESQLRLFDESRM